MDYKTLFSQTPPTRLFFKAAIPGSIGMLASALYQVADGIFISRICCIRMHGRLHIRPHAPASPRIPDTACPPP